MYLVHPPSPDTLGARFLAQAAADEVRVPLPHLTLGFTQAHPAVTSTIFGPRTMDPFDDLLAADLKFTDEVLDRIDAIVPPRSDAGRPDPSQYLTPALVDRTLRRRTAS